MMKKTSALLLLLLLLAAVGCAQPEPPPTQAVVVLPTAVLEIPPTFTLPPLSERGFPTAPVVTVTQAPLRPTNTPIPFGDNVVELWYQIPTIGLERRLQGSIGSQIILVDEVTGVAIQRNNQASVLLDLQQLLPELLMPVVPEGCTGCVYLRYELPFGQFSAEGWLRDPVVLASLENFFALNLGPHFPPNTVLGLRRNATPYAPAHSMALTEDGQLYFWLANESEVRPPITADSALQQAFAELDTSGLAAQYAAACPGTALETLFIQQAERRGSVAIVCPEYALPTPLQGVYAQLDAAIAAQLADNENVLPRPPVGFPLTAVLDYQRANGSRLTLYADGTATGQLADQPPMTEAIGVTEVISLTTEVLSAGLVRTGLNTFEIQQTQIITDANGITQTVTTTPKPPRTTLLVRGPAGVYDGEWFGGNLPAQLTQLDALLDQLLAGGAVLPEEGTPMPTEDSIGTPTPTP